MSAGRRGAFVVLSIRCELLLGGEEGVLVSCGACKSLCISVAKPLGHEIVLWCVLWHVAIPTGAWFCTLGSLILYFIRCMPFWSSQGFCCHFFRWRSSDFTYYDRAIYSVISTERSEWRNLLCASLSFRPSEASGEIYPARLATRHFI